MHYLERKLDHKKHNETQSAHWSHALRSPLANVIQFVELLQNELKRDENVCTKLEIIKQ